MRSVSRRLIDRVLGMLLSLSLLLNMFPVVTVYADDTEPTVYFEVLDEDGNELLKLRTGFTDRPQKHL